MSAERTCGHCPAAGCFHHAALGSLPLGAVPRASNLQGDHTVTQVAVKSCCRTETWVSVKERAIRGPNKDGCMGLAFPNAWPLPWWSESRALGSWVGPYCYGKPPPACLLPSHRAALSSFLPSDSSDTLTLLFLLPSPSWRISHKGFMSKGHEESRIQLDLCPRKLNHFGAMRPEPG